VVIGKAPHLFLRELLHHNCQSSHLSRFRVVRSTTRGAQHAFVSRLLVSQPGHRADPSGLDRHRGLPRATHLGRVWKLGSLENCHFANR